MKNTATTQARFWFSPSRNRLTWREPSEAIYPLTEPRDWRPLVVIDPEDREQVERLMETYRAQPGWYAGSQSQTVDCMQAALREFADPKPPRPEEPTGLGAVVEDADGNHWVLYTHPDNHAPWCDGSVSCDYGEIAVVRVLSEGVQ